MQEQPDQRRSSATQEAGVERIIARRFDDSQIDARTVTPPPILAEERLTSEVAEFLRRAGYRVTDIAAGPALLEAEDWLRHSAALIDAELRSWPSTREMASVLEISAARLRRLAARGEVASARRMGGRLVYPRWQLTGDGALISPLREVLAAFPPDFHPLDIEKFMRTPSEHLGGTTPREWLLRRVDRAAVLDLIDQLSWR